MIVTSISWNLTTGGVIITDAIKFVQTMENNYVY